MRLLIILIFLFPSISFAQDAETTISISCCSYHDERNKYNENNFGVIVTHQFKNSDFIIEGGTYKNSLSRQSHLVGFGNQFYDSKYVDVYLHGGIISGYNSNEILGGIFYGAIRVKIYNFINIEVVPGVVYGLTIDVLKF